MKEENIYVSEPAWLVGEILRINAKEQLRRERKLRLEGKLYG